MNPTGTFKSVPFAMHEDIARGLVFVDGIARSGKAMLSGIITSLDKFEHVQYFDLIEHILAGYALGAMEESYAKLLSRMALNQLTYNTRLSRGINFRRSDASGVLNYKDPKIYFDRLSRPDGDDVVNELRAQPALIPILSHDIFVNLRAFERLETRCRVIEIFRHPIDNVYSWWEKGWGGRFGEDPRAFTLTVKHEGKQVPWYVLGHEKEWIQSNPVERCALTVCNLIDRSVSEYNQCVDKSRFYVLKFEEFVTKPHEELDRLCVFLATQRTEHTERFLREARCPRILTDLERQNKLMKMREFLRPERLEELARLSRSYDKDLYGLR